MMQFAYIYVFLLLPVPFLVRMIIPAVKGLHGDALRVPFIKDLKNILVKSSGLSRKTLPAQIKFSWRQVLLWSIWATLIVALARPQLVGEPIRLKTESRDILLVTDISTSMLEPDFVISRRRVNRLEAIKKTALEFMNKRLNDRIGLILFGTNAYLQAPLTYDRKSVGEFLLQTDAGMAGQSTAIGDALGLALKTLKDSSNIENKIVILLTDGENNDGGMSLAQAVKLAKDEGVKIYTIGVGSERAFDASFLGIRLGIGPALDEDSLKAIAAETKGRYFRAKNTETLEEIYSEIDKMEPNVNDNQIIQEINDLYYIPLMIAIILALLGGLLLRRQKQ